MIHFKTCINKIDILYFSVYPDQFTINLVGVNDPEMHNSKVSFWDDVYGFKMTCMKTSVVDEVYVKTVKESTIVTNPAVIKVCTCTLLLYEVQYSFHCLKNFLSTQVFTWLLHFLANFYYFFCLSWSETCGKNCWWG